MQSEIFPKLFCHHRFVIGPVAEVHFGEGVAFEDDEVRLLFVVIIFVYKVRSSRRICEMIEANNMQDIFF